MRETGNVTLFAFNQGQGLSEHTAPFDALAHVLNGRKESEGKHVNEDTNFGKLKRIPYGPFQEFLKKYRDLKKGHPREMQK